MGLNAKILIINGNYAMLTVPSALHNLTNENQQLTRIAMQPFR